MMEELVALAKLNKRTVDALAAPATGQAFLWDTEIKGFGVRVGATGTKTFVIQYMNEEGRVRRVKIGRFGVMTVEQARELAKIQLGKVASGEVSNGVQKGPPIGVEEGPPFRII